MKPWQKVFRDGLAPCLSTPGLLALRKALADDDPRLQQGATTTPPPLRCVRDWPVEGACLVGYSFWQGDRGGDATVGEVEEFFARACFDCDVRISEPAGCRWLLNAYDEWPRQEMILNLLPEVELELDKRRGSDTMRA